MDGDAELEVYKAHRSAQDRYDYFLLAAAGAAIAFALNQTHDKVLAWSQAPLGLAILCWGLSFYFGCQHLLLVSSTLWSNGELLRVRSGRHPMTGRNPQLVQAAAQIIEEQFEKTSDRSGRMARWQFSAFLLGGILYIVWHILEMYLRTPHRPGHLF